MPLLRIVSLDPSLTATGVCDSQAPGKPFTLEPPAGLGRMARLRWIQKKVQEVTLGADLVVIEGYSYGSTTQAYYLGELGGVIRLTLYCLNIRYVDIAPAVRCKIATGKGNAKKDEVFAAAFKRLDYSGHSKDEADARWILECALQHYKHPARAQLPESHLQPLDRSRPDWPTLKELAAA